MFGFLKQKIADFGNKLKQTVAKEEEKQKPEEKIIEKTPAEKKEHKHVEEKKTDSKKEVHETKKHEQAKETTHKKVELVEKKHTEKNETKEEEIKIEKKEEKAEEKKETKPIEPKQTEKPKTGEKKIGILGKLLGFGKKSEEKKEEKHEEKKKKTKEEIAEELEKKMFAEIEEEVKKEDSKTGKEDLHAEKIKKDIEEAKELEKAREEKPTLQKAIQKEEIIKEKQVLSEVEEEIEEEEKEITQIKEQEERLIPEEKSRDIKIKSIEEEKRELKAKVGVTGGIKGFLFGGIEITEKQIEDLVWELELSLIESDVEQDAAVELVTQIKKKLIGTKVSAKNLDDYLKEQIKEILTEMMKTEKISLLEETKKHKPLKILILGPNGAGKTTSIAKLVHYFQKHKKTCIVAAADTFRAGAIDQIEEHAKRLNIRVIKQQYGADPAAVAFDAIKAAEAAKLDVVIIDSAGRQETNKNLMEELRKLERVAKPDVKIYVGEAYVGQTLLEQVEEFKEIIGIDGFILTKIDTDAKGGTAISLLYKMKKPILFVGIGQGYDDFKEFTPEFILDRII